MLTELFGAINTIASLVPEFSEEKKELLQKETEVYSKLERILNKIMLELKAQEVLAPENEAQLLNYLKATEYEVGLLLNFGKKPEIKRKIFSNDLK